MNLSDYLERRRRQVDAALEAYFPVAAARGPRLIEAIRYSLLGGGKRIRPILLLASAEAVGADAEPFVPFACGVEMIHAYSLIHDDLPAMDDDRLRRGRPSSHVAFGEGLAILAGDALLTEAFRVMLEAGVAGREPGRALQAVREIADAAGAHGMVGGQAADLEAEGTVPDLPTVEFIHVRKTGALLLASVRSGAVLAGAPTGRLLHLTRYGECLGLAFQIADDILDAEGGASVTGKTPGRDQARRKATFPSVLGLPAAKERARELLRQSVAELETFDALADPLREIARFVVGRACDLPR